MVYKVKVAAGRLGKEGDVCFPGDFFYDKAGGADVTFDRRLLPELLLGVESSEAVHFDDDDVGVIVYAGELF